LHPSEARSVERISRRDGLAVVVILLIVLCASLPNLRSGDIDELDAAHHIMDGYFFYDLFHDLPRHHLQQYALDYYKQYPALGFVFWPPLFPFVLGAFDTLFGPHVLTARLCILFFGEVFALAFYFILRRTCPLSLSLAAIAATVFAPGIFWSFNEVMLELPTLAVMCLAVLAFLHMIDRADSPTGTGRALLCAIACAAVIYAKQPAWFLYPALLTVALVHRRIFRKPEPWIAMAAIAVFCIPLVVFTLKFGHADLAQSVGNNTKLIMPTYQALPRWSVAAWSFYPRLAWPLLGPVVVLLACGALVLAVFRRDFLRAHILWVAWFLFAYVTFSYYDNRFARHSTFWWPAWIALAAACLNFAAKLAPPLAARALPLVLLLPLPWLVRKDRSQDYTDLRQQRHTVAGLYAHSDPGNILLIGAYKQAFVALIREYDAGRKDHVVRGDTLLQEGEDLNGICRRYRIGVVLFAPPQGDGLPLRPELLALTASPAFQPLEDTSYLHRDEQHKVLAFRYTGPVDAKMADLPLSDRLF